MRRATLASITILLWLVPNAFAADADVGAEGATGPRGESVFDGGEARVAAELLVDATSVAAGDRVRVGVLFALDPGWHIYWRNSGDSGIPTKTDWNIAGAKLGEIAWPAPEVFS